MSEELAHLRKVLDRMQAGRSAELGRDTILRDLIVQLVAARQRAGMTQAQVAGHMFTTPSVVSRLEAGRHTRPSLRTIERYARAVGCKVEIRIR